MDFLTWITDFTATLPVGLIWTLGSALSFAESGLGLGLFFPGETAILIVSAALTTPWSAVVMAALVTLFACAGDHVGYLLGRRYGSRIRGTRLVRRFGVQHWDRSIALLEKQGARAILLTRPVPIVRILTPAAAGVAGSTYPRFLAASFSGAAIWSVLYVGLGYLLRSSLDAVEKYLSSFGWLVGGVLALIAAVAIGREVVTRRRRKAGSSPAPKGVPTRSRPGLVEFVRRRSVWIDLALEAVLVVAIAGLSGAGLLVGGAVAGLLLLVGSLPWVRAALASRPRRDPAALRPAGAALLTGFPRVLSALPPVALATAHLVPWVIACTLLVPLVLVGVLEAGARRQDQRPLPCDSVRPVVVAGATLAVLIGVAIPELRWLAGLATLGLFAAIVLACIDGATCCRRLASPASAHAHDVRVGTREVSVSDGR